MKQPREHKLLFIVLLCLGGVWAAALAGLPGGAALEIFAAACGVAFAVAYVWLLLARVRHLLHKAPPLPRALARLLAELSVLILAFGWAQSHVGLMDNSVDGKPVTHSLLTGVYYSVVTFTTLGYGDMYPRGVGRVYACVESLVGYFVLATIASTASSILSPYERPHTPVVPGSGDEGDSSSAAAG